LKKSQITENPRGDHFKMFRHKTKGGWTFSDQDQGWPVSDCTAESLEVTVIITPPFCTNILVISLKCKQMFWPFSLVLSILREHAVRAYWKKNGCGETL